MSGNSIALNYILTGDDRSASSAVKGVGKHADELGSKLGSTFSSLGSKIGGEFGEILSKTGEGLDKLGESGGGIAPKFIAGGAAIAGVGAALTLMGSKEKQATDQLDQAITNAGQNVKDYAGKIEETVKQQENFGHSAVTTKNALQILVQATGDTQTAVEDMGLVSNIAAARHISLGEAATLVATVLAGGGKKALAQFGVTLDQSITDKSARAQEALTQLSQKVDGQAAKSVDNWSGKLHVAEVKLGDLASEAGSKFGPAIVGVGGVVEAFGVIMEMSFVKKGTQAAKALIGIGDAEVSMASKVGRSTAALGAFGVVLAAGVAIWEHFQSQSAAAKQRVDDFTQAIEADNGAIGENTTKLIANNLEKSGALDIAKKLGLSLDTVTSAAEGNAAAYNTVKAAADAYYKDNVIPGILAEDTLLGSIKQNTDAYHKGAAAADDIAAATVKVVPITESMTAAYDASQSAIRANVSALAAFDSAMFKAKQDMLGNTLTADQWKLSLLQLRDQIKTNGRSLDDVTQKGIENRDSILTLVQSLQQQASQEITNGKTMAQVAPQYQTRVNQLKDAAVKAGFNKQQVDLLLGSYLKLPASVTTTIQTPGLDAALNNAGLFQTIINNLSGSKSIDSKLNGLDRSGPHRAAGGPVSAGVAYTVGELGPETFVPEQSGHIIPTGGGSAGNTYVTVNVQGMLSNERDLIAAVEAAAANSLRSGTWRPSGRGLVTAGG